MTTTTSSQVCTPDDNTLHLEPCTQSVFCTERKEEEEQATRCYCESFDVALRMCNLAKPLRIREDLNPGPVTWSKLPY